MKKFVIAATFIVASLLGFATPAFAESPGQLAGGDLYQVRNVTKNTGYANTVAATCNETVKFSFKLSNTEYGMIYGVKVATNLQNGSATATGTNTANASVSVSDTASVTLDKGSLSYVAGSTQLYTVDGQLIRGLADGITTGGVSAGNLAGSTREFVQFQAKVECETPAPEKITVCELATKKIVTINKTDFDASKHSKNLADCDTPAPEKITVCDLTTHKVVTINKTDFDASKHTKDLSQCDKIMVCELNTKNIVTIYRSEYDAAKHSTDLNKCAKAPEGSIKVCVIATKEIVTIKEGEFDASKHTRDLNVCAKVVTPVVPTTPTAPAVIAATGPVGTLATMLGLSGLAASATYFVRSRKANILG